MLNLNFYNQIDECTTREPLFVMSSDIYMTKKDEEVVKPTNPKFYKRFVDDIINKNKKDQPDLLFDSLIMTITPISSIPLKQCLKSSLTQS